MILLKLLGAGILLLCGAGVSALICERKGRVLREIDGFLSLFRHLRREIECYRRTVPLALASLPLKTAEVCLGGVASVPTDLSAFVAACPMRAEGLADVVRGAASELGRGNLAEQLRILDTAERALAALYEKEEKRARQEKGTARAACLGTAAFAVILLI